ncbi:hypothetical protein M918_08700 [Clostridium sp. BL8]|nr:hypothetical protein M918_08700 [Clostridium sp. BL8]
MGYVTVFIYGLIIGSFLNVCVYRIPLNQSIVYPPSNCPRCNTRLNWKDLIPVLSYAILKGKCRYCGNKISITYPVQELFTAIIFLITYYKYGFSIYLFKYVILFSILIVISNIDIKHQDVYTSTTIPGIISGLIFAIIEQYFAIGSFKNYFIGAVIAAVIIGLIVYITGAMGEGDIEIAALCGTFIGWKLSILMIILAFILGGVIGTILIATNIKGRRDYMAFGPFLALGALISVLFGSAIINYYLVLFF